jgi:CheY-like chemotaxis protein
VYTYADVTAHVSANEQLRTAVLGLTLAKDQLNADMQLTRQQSDEKLRFVASVSHEIRTPLNGIMGMLDLIGRSGLNPTVAGLVEDVKTSTTQLRRLTDDILDLSSLKEAKFPLATQPFDLGDLVNKTVRAAQGAAQAAGTCLELLMRDAPCGLIGDAERLAQILNNLIYNAIKFTQQGTVRVHVEWQAPDSAADHVEVVISVSDSGRGIAPGALSRIFEPFDQGDDSINRDYGGTGLGLAVCRELSEAMGGNIRVTSREGQGSVFTVTVMLQRSTHGTAVDHTPQTAPEPAAPTLIGKRILVVDDNRINQKLLSMWLTEAGARVRQANDGSQGLCAASDALFDCILMDVSMPVMNGLQATAAIRLLAQSEDAQLRTRAAVPIIGVTAGGMDNDIRQCLEAGMDAHLCKPLERVKLLRTLKDVMEAHVWLSNTGT